MARVQVLLEKGEFEDCAEDEGNWSACQRTYRRPADGGERRQAEDGRGPVGAA